jgi:hypothetical protein
VADTPSPAPPNEMVLRIARFLDPYAFIDRKLPISDMGETVWYAAHQQAAFFKARALLVELREPTKDMSQADRIVWRSVIDAVIEAEPAHA